MAKQEKQIEQKAVATKTNAQTIIDRKVEQYRQLIITDRGCSARIDALIFSHKIDSNIPLYLDVARPTRFTKRGNNSFPSAWRTNVTAIKTSFGQSMVNWIEDIEEIQKLIIETGYNNIPGISQNKTPNSELRDKNLATANKKFQEIQDHLSKTSNILKELKELGFTTTDLTPKVEEKEKKSEADKPKKVEK